MALWVTLDEFVNDLELSDVDTADDLEEADRQRYARRLDGATDFVERIHRGRYNFTNDPQSDLPAPDETLKLGTLMLARRWNTRRRSPEGLVTFGEGASRVSFDDPDLNRQLRIGRHAIPRLG